MFGAELALAELAVAHHSERRRGAVGEGALFRLGLRSRLRLGLGLFRLLLLLQEEVVLVGLLVVVQDGGVGGTGGGETGHCGGGSSQHLRGHGHGGAAVAAALARRDVQREVHHQVWVGDHRVRRDVVRAERLGVVQLVAAVPQVDAAWREVGGPPRGGRQGHDGGDLQVLDGGVVGDRQAEGVFVAGSDRELHSVCVGGRGRSGLIRAGGGIRICGRRRRACCEGGRMERNRRRDRNSQGHVCCTTRHTAQEPGWHQRRASLC